MTNPEERSGMMQDVDKIRKSYTDTGAITSSDLYWLLDKMEIGERLAKTTTEYKEVATTYIEFLKAELVSQGFAKDIEIHELKERLKQYEPEIVENEAPETP